MNDASCRPRRAAAVAILLLLGILAFVAMFGAPRPAAAADCGPVNVGDPGKRFPVILIHGFNGDRSAMGPTRDALVGAGLDVHIVDFEYPCAKTEWVENPNIGLRLQNAIKDLADTSMSNGGPGRVAVIGHSMGGLATRQALTGGDLDGRMAFLATYGTPHTGSGYNRALASPDWPFPEIRRFLIEERQVPLDSNAGLALQAFSEQINRLQPISGTYPVLSMAGDYVVGQRIGWWTNAASFGDFIVEVPSAHSQSSDVGGIGGPASTVCEFTLPFYGAGPIGDSILAEILRHQWANRPDLDNCYHGNLMRDPNLQRITVEQMRAVIDRTERRTPPDPCARVIDDLNASGGNPGGFDLELIECEGSWAIAAPVVSGDDSGDGLIVASRGDDGRWAARGLIPGLSCSDVQGLGAPKSIWERANGDCDSETGEGGLPSCSADLFVAAYNDLARSSDPYVGGDQPPECDGDVAVAWVEQTDDSERNPDFGAAVFVARGGRWNALGRFRPGAAESFRTDERVIAATTSDQRERLLEILQAGWIGE